MLERRWPTVPLILAAALLAGCAAKTDLEAARAELAACREESARLRTDSERWQQRFDRASSRWETMRAEVMESVPNALAEIDAQRERILELVPEQVQADVSGYLDEYFDVVMDGFEVVHQDARDIKLQLDATQKALATLGADTRSIGEAIDEAVATERGKRQSVADGLAALHERVVAFDRDRLNCKTCEERIRLSRKEREAILAFHADLLAATAALQQTIGR